MQLVNKFWEKTQSIVLNKPIEHTCPVSGPELIIDRLKSPKNEKNDKTRWQYNSVFNDIYNHQCSN